MRTWIAKLSLGGILLTLLVARLPWHAACRATPVLPGGQGEGSRKRRGGRLRAAKPPLVNRTTKGFPSSLRATWPCGLRSPLWCFCWCWAATPGAP